MEEKKVIKKMYCRLSQREFTVIIDERLDKIYEEKYKDKPTPKTEGFNKLIEGIDLSPLGL